VRDSDILAAQMIADVIQHCVNHRLDVDPALSRL
jgi:hypothetical protein